VRINRGILIDAEKAHKVYLMVVSNAVMAGLGSLQEKGGNR
jgi:hypothetical protein